MKYEVESVVKVLLESERVCVQDLRNRLNGYTEQEVELTIWRARDEVRREHGIDFIAKPTGYLTRATPIQTAHSAFRQRRAGTRKQIRAGERLRLASEKTEDEKERDRFARAADRAVERAELAKRRI